MIAVADQCKLLVFNNANSIAVTLPRASTTFPVGFVVHVADLGAGTATVTPTTSTINGTTTAAAAQNAGFDIYSDGTNYYTQNGGSIAGASLSGNNTFSGTNTFSGQVISTFGTPTIASGACGATTNGSIAGSNQSGLITIGAATTTACAISFSATLGTAPNAVVLFPANATAAATGTTVARISAISTGGFTITGSALASSNYYYIVL